MQKYSQIWQIWQVYKKYAFYIILLIFYYAHTTFLDANLTYNVF